MTNTEFIETFRAKVALGEITDIESYCYCNNVSRTKAQKELNGQDWAGSKIGKHFIYIKK